MRANEQVSEQVNVSKFMCIVSMRASHWIHKTDLNVRHSPSCESGYLHIRCCCCCCCIFSFPFWFYVYIWALLLLPLLHVYVFVLCAYYKFIDVIRRFEDKIFVGISYDTKHHCLYTYTHTLSLSLLTCSCVILKLFAFFSLVRFSTNKHTDNQERTAQANTYARRDKEAHAHSCARVRAFKTHKDTHSHTIQNNNPLYPTKWMKKINFVIGFAL